MSIKYPGRRRLKTNFEIIAQRQKVEHALIKRINAFNEKLAMHNEDATRIWNASKDTIKRIEEIKKNRDMGIPIGLETKNWLHKVVAGLEKKNSFEERRMNRFYDEINSIKTRARKAGSEEVYLLSKLMFLHFENFKHDIAGQKKIVADLKREFESY